MWPDRSSFSSSVRAQRVAPVPAAAELFAKPRASPLGMFGQETLHLSDVLAAQLPSFYHHHACHGSQSTA